MPPSKAEKEYAIDIAHENNILYSNREIFLFGSLDEDGEFAKKFITNMRILENYSNKPIIIHQYNLGGDWSSGMAMFDAICQSECGILFICYGIAASMGSVLPMACHQRDNALVLTHKNCQWLLHEGTTAVHSELTNKQSRSWYAIDQIWRKTMIEYYIDACEKADMFAGKTRKQIEKYIQKQLDEYEDWILLSQDAVNHGFSDGILGFDVYPTIKESLKHLE